MASVRVEGLTKRYGSLTALRDLNFEVSDGDFFSLLGPPGAGKTTTLRMIAGLERPDEGMIWLSETQVDEIHPKDRDVAMVFEDLALYPHWTAFNNLAHPLKIRKIEPAQIEARVREVARLLHIDHLLERHPGTFSGGERRRVAIGRALVRRPRVLLLDEPLTDLDAKIRQEMTGELKRLQTETGQTMIYATHDYEESVAMANHILVIHKGREEQTGSAQEVYDCPETAFVASFVGSPAMNLVRCQLGRQASAVSAQHPAFRITLRAPSELDVPPEGLLGIRPEQVELRPTHADGIPAQVDIVQVLGEEQIADLSLKDGTIIKIVLPLADELTPGRHCTISFPSEHIFIFSMESGQRLVGPDRCGSLP